MGIQFQELWSWVRRRKIFASLLVAVTLVHRDHDRHSDFRPRDGHARASGQRSRVAGDSRPGDSLERFFRHFEEIWSPRSSTFPRRR